MAVKHRYTLICDEVRQEINGKYLVIGLYTGPLMVPQIPIPLNLTFAHFFETDRPGRLSLKFWVERLDTGRRLVEGQGQGVVAGQGFGLAPIRVPIQIDGEGAHNFVLQMEGESETILTPFMVTIIRQSPTMPGMMPMMPPMR